MVQLLLGTFYYQKTPQNYGSNYSSTVCWLSRHLYVASPIESSIPIEDIEDFFLGTFKKNLMGELWAVLEYKGGLTTGFPKFVE